MHPPAELALAAGTPGSGSLRSQLRFRPMNLPLKASVLINSISGGRSTWANFCLLHCRAQAHPHPLSKNRIQSWRGGRRLESKNEFKTRSKTTQPRRRENKQRRAKVYARAHTPRKRAGEGGRGAGGPGGGCLLPSGWDWQSGLAACPSVWQGWGWRVALFMPGAAAGDPGGVGAVSGADWLPQTTGVSHGLVGWTQGCPTVPDVARSFKDSEA